MILVEIQDYQIDEFHKNQAKIEQENTGHACLELDLPALIIALTVAFLSWVAIGLKMICLV